MTKRYQDNQEIRAGDVVGYGEYRGTVHGPIDAKELDNIYEDNVRIHWHHHDEDCFLTSGTVYLKLIHRVGGKE